MERPNARAGVCGILTPRHDEGEVAPLALGERKLNPKHGERLKQARDLELAGIARPKPPSATLPITLLLSGPSGPATNITALPSGKRGFAMTLKPVLLKAL
jgi:hypothetical protein